MNQGLTREDILRNFPGAPEDFIQRNLGVVGIPLKLNTGLSGTADLFEQAQRETHGGNRGGKASTIDTSPEMAVVTSWVTNGQSVAITTKEGPALPAQGKTSKGWIEIGGKRFYSKSMWERNYARYLQLLREQGHLQDWSYEPETFWFEGIKRGTNNYKPDFRVIDASGAIDYREVKGWMDKKSRTKIRRMKKYHPTVTLLVISASWFKKWNRVFIGMIPGWEKPKKK